MSGPLPNALDVAESAYRLVDGVEWLEHAWVVERSLCHGSQSSTPGVRHSECRRFGARYLRCSGKRQREGTSGNFTRRELGAAKARELATEIAAGRNADLLAQNGARSELETIPAAGGAQHRALGNQRSEHAIASKMGANRSDVRAKIEDPADAGDDCGQRTDGREANGGGETLRRGRCAISTVPRSPSHSTVRR